MAQPPSAVLLFALAWMLRPAIILSLTGMISQKYHYRRNLPHIEKSDRSHFITFVTYGRWTLPPHARDLALSHCTHEHKLRIELHICVVMPDHLHMIFTPLRNAEGETFTFRQILNSVKGASAHSINKALGRSGRVWLDESFDHVLRSQESLESKIDYVRMNPVRSGLVKRPKDYQWLWEPE